MARTKAFDPDEVVTLAMRAFWADGYERTSLDRLLAQTGLSKSSLYDTFGDKRSLFFRALDCYARLQQKLVSEVCGQGESMQSRLRSLLCQVADDSVDSTSLGCLMLNAVSDFGATDPTVRAIAKSNADAIRRMLASALRNGVAAGEFKPDLDTGASAGFLFGLLSSFRIQGRSGVDRIALQQQIEMSISLLVVTPPR